MNAEELSAVAGILLSLGFSYIPGVNERFAQLSPTGKRIVMLAMLAIAALGAFGLSCAGLETGAALQCDRSGAWGLARSLAAAIIANQAAFAISPQVVACSTPAA